MYHVLMIDWVELIWFVKEEGTHYDKPRQGKKLTESYVMNMYQYIMKINWSSKAEKIVAIKQYHDKCI